MENKIKDYVQQLLSSARNGDAKNEIMEELTVNLCEKYNDLISCGVEPEKAYSEVINSIGDVAEIVSFINLNTPESTGQNFDFNSSFDGFEKKIKDLAKEFEGPMREVANDFKNAANSMFGTAMNAKEPIKNAAGQVAREFKNVVKNIDFSMQGKNSYRYDYTVSSEDVHSMDIQLSGGRVSFGVSQDDNIYVVEYSRAQLPEDKRASIFLSDETLRISQGKGSAFIFFGYGIISSDFEIYLPKRRWNAINIKTAGGKIDLDSDLEACDIFAKSVSGSIECKNAICDNIVLTSVSGDIELSGQFNLTDIKTTSGDVEFSGASDKVILNTISGDAELRLDNVPSDIQTESTSGDIRLFIPDNDGFTLNYKRVSGDLKSDFNLMTSLNSKSGFAVYRNGDLHCYTAKTVSGDIKILKR